MTKKQNVSAYHISIVSALSVVFFVALGLSVFFKPILREEAQKLLVFPYIVFEMIITPIIYGVGAVTIFSLIAIWKDIRIRNEKVRWLFLICSIIVIASYILGVIYFIISFNDVGYPAFCWKFVEWLLEYPFVFSLLGIVFFYGINRSHKKYRGQNSQTRF